VTLTLALSGYSSQLRVAVVRSEKLIAEAGDSSGTQRKVECPSLEAATKQWLVRTEKTSCML
jgi:hypothetical protein